MQGGILADIFVCLAVTTRILPVFFLGCGFKFRIFAPKINEKEEKMKTDRIIE